MRSTRNRRSRVGSRDPGVSRRISAAAKRAGAAVMLYSAAAFAQAPVPPGAPPVAVVEALHEGIVEVAAEGARPLEERYEALRPLVARTHDLPYIAELSIRRYWDDLAQPQRERFVAAFERLSVMTYVTRFAEAGPETFEIAGSEEVTAGRVQVHAVIPRESEEDVSLDYLLHETDGGWRIVNVLADDVSDLALKRAEYHRILSEGTIEDLVAELEAQADAL